MKRSSKLIFLSVLILLSALSLCLAQAVYLKQFDFNDKDALKKWGEMVLNGKVEYELVKVGEGGYIRALSQGSASARYFRIGYKLKEYPIINWKWKALRFPDKSRAQTDKEKDDYAARIYIIFPYLNFSSSKFIEYVWAEDTPIGTVLESPVGNNVKMVVARSGEAREEFISESRNVYEDYIRAFGDEPRRSVGAIAMMCDADSTGTSAESLFDDIAIIRK